MSAGKSLSTLVVSGAVSTICGRIIAVKWPLFLGTTPEEIQTTQGACQTVFMGLTVGILYLVMAILRKYNIDLDPDNSPNRIFPIAKDDKE